jgi:hypothetical protein
MIVGPTPNAGMNCAVQSEGRGSRARIDTSRWGEESHYRNDQVNEDLLAYFNVGRLFKKAFKCLVKVDSQRTTTLL